MQQQFRPQATTIDAGRTIDAGLQGYMRGVFNTMAMGLVLTGGAAYAVANIEPLFNLVFKTPLAYVVMFAPLAFLFLGFTPGRIARSSPEKLKTLFYFFAVVMGVSMASIFMVFSGASIARAFFATAAAFAGTALYGYVTKRDLTKMGSFLIMGLIGIFVASLLNIIFQSAAVQFIVSMIGVVVFTGLTAFETQRLKEIYAYNGGGEQAQKYAIMGALNLYLNFVNLFQIMLSFMGGRRE
jgi:uncharacterized protein